MRKLVSILLCVCLVASLLTVAAFAADGGEETSACGAVLQGYQNKTTGYDVRIVAEVSNLDAYSEVGFVLSNGVKEVRRAASYVFRTLTASNSDGGVYEALTASEDNYLYALTIGDIAAEDALRLTVAPYTVSTTGETVVGAEKTLLKAANGTFTKAHGFAVAGEGFTIAETVPTLVADGTDLTLTITANDGYRIDSVTADTGAAVTVSGNAYTIGNITADTTVTVATTLLSAEAEARLADMMKTEGNFWSYFNFGAWGSNSWGEGNTVVNLSGSNFTIQRKLIDDALLAGYTHMKLHVKAVAKDGAAIDHLTMITYPGAYNYYWKQYSCASGETDFRVDLTVYGKAGHETDALKISVHDASGKELSSDFAVSGVEFFRSEETVGWTKSNECVYVADENGTLVIDTVAAGDGTHVQIGAERLAELKAKYRYVRFAIADVSTLKGPVWFGNGSFSGDNSYMQGIASDTAFPAVVVDLSRCEILDMYFTGQETAVEISYDWIAGDYQNHEGTYAPKLAAEGLDAGKTTVVKFKYHKQGDNYRAPLVGKTTATIINGVQFNECTDLGNGWYQFTLAPGFLDEDGNLYFSLDKIGSFFYEITQE